MLAGRHTPLKTSSCSPDIYRTRKWVASDAADAETGSVEWPLTRDRWYRLTRLYQIGLPAYPALACFRRSRDKTPVRVRFASRCVAERGATRGDTAQLTLREIRGIVGPGFGPT